MAVDIKEVTSSFFEWLKTQPQWQQELAEAIYLNQDIDHEIFAKKCFKESNVQFTNEPAKIKESYNFFGNRPSSYELKLVSISDIQNICGLNPRKSFALSTDKNLNIVYGKNGSGKSSYIRILKSACGSKGKSNEKILPNIYKDSSDQSQSCHLSFSVDGRDDNLIWKPGMEAREPLTLVDIFDEDTGKIYVDEKNTVSYEPYVLAFISRLTDSFLKISNILRDKKELIESSLAELSIPLELQETSSAEWYKNLTYQTKKNEIDEICFLSKEEEIRMNKLVQTLEVENFNKAIKSIETKKNQVNILKMAIEKVFDIFNIGKFQKLLLLKQKLDKKKEAADQYSSSISDLSSLEGFGSDFWRNLFISAREYSERHAYKERRFPVTDDDAKCVLCQQDLSEKAKKRLKKFDEFMQGKLEEELRNATKKYNELKQDIKRVDIITEDQINTLFDTSSIDDDPLKKLILDFFKVARGKKDKMESFRNINELPLFKVAIKGKEYGVKEIYLFILEELDDIINKYTKEIESIKIAAKKENKPALIKELNELKAKDLLSKYIGTVKKEYESLVKIYKFKNAMQSASTQSLSKKKSELSEKLITNRFIDNFNNELKNLNLSNLKASLRRTETSYGETLHKVSIQGFTTEKPKEVLSSGEYKMIAIAAFLADIQLRDWKAPIIFDDPITSLSEDYEECLAQRMVELSRKSQVIVFSHRISFLYLVEEHSEENIEINSFCLEKEAWGAGEPTDLPFDLKNFPSMLKDLKARLEKAKTLLGKSGMEAYRNSSASIERDFRIMLEAVIERVLMSKVVLRFKRSITTSKIKELAKINIDDCNFIDDLMTKYSYSVHLDPASNPRRDLTPDELEDDINELLKWYDEFRKRLASDDPSAHLVDNQIKQDTPTHQQLS